MATSICYSTECEKIIKIYRHKPKHNCIAEYQVYNKCSRRNSKVERPSLAVIVAVAAEGVNGQRCNSPLIIMIR